ncbi:MAG: zinc ribbon domain-containing protein [Chloroflexota bacterium]|nr:zinc ribbon domain-containing protein [Chloroflexota bacterium]
MDTYYQRLNILPTATVVEIKAAYARMRAELIAAHSDNDADIDGNLATLDEAYTTLVDPNQRAAYDRSLDGTAKPGTLAVTGRNAMLTVPQAPPVPMAEQACPHCGFPNPVRATICTACNHQVSRPCPQCGQPVLLGQSVCARCEAYVPEYDQRRFAEALTTEQRVHTERRETASRVAAKEAIYRVQARYTAVFWFIVIALCIGLSLFASYLSNYVDR